MKTFHKTSLPHTIEYNYDVYELACTMSQYKSITEFKLYCDLLKQAGHKVVLCNVLSKNLRGKTDLHGNLYKPSQWIFIK